MLELILFVSNHCPGCRPMEEKCSQVAIDADAKLTVVNIDESEENLNLARMFYIMSTPTLLVKKDGEIVDQIIGNVGINTIEKAVNV